MARSVVLVVGLPLLMLGPTVGTASASGAGTVTIYAGISQSQSIAAGPDGAMWFTNGTIQGDYDLNRHALKVTLASRGMDIAALRQHALAAGIPVLRDLQAGRKAGFAHVGMKQVAHRQRRVPAAFTLVR